ncbi:SWF or SNF family helicase [Streptomyces sp. NBC_01619]|uniref:SWF or SNF family helicase n=1 Tax=Streptomyces sp. NBC_01619 TaxID=2975901 RepID=UPI00225C1E44|nr:SWF or SNF family helicase [Streptomyces sp. NBC_01619]MCX4515448.1 SWF or SNF family helicase [Streptomyces sp. NBC_01619]
MTNDGVINGSSGGYGGYEDERTFAALPPARGRGFAQTWWGRAWLKALEDTALESEQLKKGRRQARDGAVGAVSVRPGRITAVVRDRDGTAYRSDVLLQELTGDEWHRFLDMAVDRAGHIAALLDREMPPHLVEDAADAGVELLPGIGDLEPECTCEAWDLCPHTAALCYQVARLLDQDPFVLLLLRGRGERRLLDALQVRSAARAEPSAAAPEGVPEGVRADEAFAAAGILPPLPAVPRLPAEPGLPPSLDTETAPPQGIDGDALEFLAADAAVRAHRMLAEALGAVGGQPLGELPGDPVLTAGQDAVRLAATARSALPAEVAARLAAGSGRERSGLELAVRAWRFGGAAGLAVLADDPVPDEVLARAEAQLAQDRDEGGRPRLRAAGAGRWTVPGAQAQLRVGADGRWWPFTRSSRGPWTPAGPPAPDPASALAGLLPEA